MPLVTQVLKLLALSLAALFLLGAVATAVPALFGGSKVRTLFNDSQDALGGDTRGVTVVHDAGAPDAAAQVEARERRLYLHASKAGPMPLPEEAPEPPAVDAGSDAGRERVFFPASKSPGGMLFNDNPAKQVDP